MLGAHEAVLFNHLGFVAECSGDNIFIVKNGELLTPDTAAGILAGITRNIVIELARKRGITVTEKPLVRDDLYAAHECFLTGTAAEIIAVPSFDGLQIRPGNPGALTSALHVDYDNNPPA